MVEGLAIGVLGGVALAWSMDTPASARTAYR